MKNFARQNLSSIAYLLTVAVIALIGIATGHYETIGAALGMAYIRPNSIKVRTRQGTQTIGLDQVARTPMKEFAGYMDNIVGARTQIYYDAIVLASGTNLVAGSRLALFKEGIEESGVIWNTGVNYKKTKLHTNMVEDGQFEYGVSVIAYAFELLFIALPQLPDVVSANGEITASSDDGAQPAGYNPVNFARALLTQNTYQFRRGSDVTEENGLLIDIPSNAGLSGAIGGQTTLSIVQNSLGPSSARLLEYPKVLHSKENFQVDIEAQASTFAVPVPVLAWFRMICKRLRTTE
jgi:hypothetical protein